MSDGKRPSDIYERSPLRLFTDFVRTDTANSEIGDESGQGKQQHLQSGKKSIGQHGSRHGSETKLKLNFDSPKALSEYNTENNLYSGIEKAENRLVIQLLDDKPSPSLKRSNDLKLKHIASPGKNITSINDCSQFHNGNFLNQIKNKNIYCSTPSAKIRFSINEADQKKFIDSLLDNYEGTSELMKGIRGLNFSDDIPSPVLKRISQDKDLNSNNQIEQNYFESYSTKQKVKKCYCSTPSSKITFPENKIDHISLFESILRDQKVKNFLKNRVNNYINSLKIELDIKKSKILFKEAFSRVLELFMKRKENAIQKEAAEAPERISTISSVKVSQLIPANHEPEPESKDKIEEKDFKHESTKNKILSSNKKSSEMAFVEEDIDDINEDIEKEKFFEGSHNSEEGSEFEFNSEEENDNANNGLNQANQRKKYVKSNTLKCGNVNKTLEKVKEKDSPAESDEANFKIISTLVLQENEAGFEFPETKPQQNKNKDIDLPKICEKSEEINPKDLDRGKVKKYQEDIFEIISKNKKDHNDLNENQFNNEFRFYDSSRAENLNIIPINENVIEKQPNHFKIIDDMPLENIIIGGPTINLSEIVKSQNYLFIESSSSQRLNLKHLVDNNYFGDFENLITLNASIPLKKLEIISDKVINLPLSSNKNISLTESAVSKKIIKQSDHVSSEILEFCESRRKTLKELENRIQTKNQLINNLNFHWEEAEYEKNSDIKSSNLNNNFAYLSQLSLDKSNADSEFSYLFDFIIHNSFEQFHVYELIKEAFDSSKLLLNGNSIQAKISKDLQDFSRKYNTLRSEFNNQNNPIIFKELITEITEFILDIHTEFKKTRDILTTKNNKENLAFYSLRLKLDKNKNRTISEMKKIKSITEKISQDSYELNLRIENVTDNKILISRKSLKISEKRKDFDVALKIFTDETNETINSVLKSKRYGDKIAFCDFLLSMVNNEYFQNDHSSKRIENLKEFITERNLNSSLFCDHIFNIYETYLNKVSEKNINELKNIRALKLKTHKDNKIKLKQIQIFMDTRNQELTSLEASIKNSIKKKNEIQTKFKFSYSSFFLVTKIILILVIFLNAAKIIDIKLFSF